ncbi:hypothetical protein HMPREF0653_01826 [Prevotella disiens JCM 6334 = ATCC 29426]|uniref:Uncharacterized protein n=1 Tax=Prevotella disiens JCM 6334 = ATCC 29426 TaxID=1235811 RepID=A0ABN0NQX0_9BACT|nr:hypothetical protein HMPREF0653_01826 [Prevotella disiens JCM 6334 = ATCC 29426]
MDTYFEHQPAIISVSIGLRHHFLTPVIAGHLRNASEAKV